MSVLLQVCYTVYILERKQQMRKEHLIPPEKSKKVIYLDRRGKTLRGYTVAARVFGILGILCMLYCLLIGLFMGYGTLFFLIWGAMAVACGTLSFLLWQREWLTGLPKWIKCTCVAFFAAGMLLFGIVEGLILSCFGMEAQPGADYVVVLGAQYKANGPSYVLQKRLDKAVEYLYANPETRAIVSGGQGSNEPISEALGMYNYLVDAGIEAERILMEDQSTSTCENLVYSSSLLDVTGDRVVLVTNNFHLFRACKIAKKIGYEKLEGLAADSYPAMLPNNLLREFFGVIKDFVVGNL